MIIFSKFPGTCLVCQGSFSVNERINWVKDTGSWHLRCTLQTPKPAPASASTPVWIEPNATIAPVRIIQRRGKDKPRPDDAVGITFRTTARRAPSDYPNTLVTVIAQRAAFIDPRDAEVPEQAGWNVTLYCRLANEHEKNTFEAAEKIKANQAYLANKRKEEEIHRLKSHEGVVMFNVKNLQSDLVCAGELPMPNGTDTLLGAIKEPPTKWYMRVLNNPLGEVIVHFVTDTFDSISVGWWGSIPLANEALHQWAKQNQLTPERAKDAWHQWIQQNNLTPEQSQIAKLFS